MILHGGFNSGISNSLVTLRYLLAIKLATLKRNKHKIGSKISMHKNYKIIRDLYRNP